MLNCYISILLFQGFDIFQYVNGGESDTSVAE